MMKKLLLGIASLALALPLLAAPAQDEARLLRFPAVGGGKIVFCYAGNLYSVGIDGGRAVKLTSDVGYECFPKISPDGRTVAFTAQYDGNTEVYTIPITGGEPKRITYSALVGRDQVGERMGPNNIVMGWTPDGKQIVYRSKQWCFSGLRAQLCKVDAQGGLPEFIPTTEGGFCSYSPDGKQLAMNRMFREFRTWKYYRGGQADDIWINTVGTTKLEKITDNDAQDIFPMWIGNEIYYLSDRDRTMNLFVYDTKSKQSRKVTDFTEYDCKFPAHSADGYVVFENGGYIYKYDVRKGAAEKVSIQLADDNVWSRTEYRSGNLSINGYSLSPDGKRVLMVARGDIFSLPAEKGPVVNISRSPGSHEREAEWSPELVELCAARQKRILADVWPALRDGGLLIYSTCTYEDAENDANLRWAAETLGGKIIPPEDEFGAYGVRLTSCGSLLRAGEVPGEGQWVGALVKAMPVATEEQPLTYATATRGLTQKTPSWALRPSLSASCPTRSAPRVEVTLEQARKYLHRDSFPLPEAPLGMITVCYRGHPLGLAKNLGKRINNLYPKNRRILMDI